MTTCRSELQAPPPKLRNIPGEMTRFYVESRRKGILPHLVDLQEYNGNGACGCEHFQIRIKPLIERGQTAPHWNPDALRCHHIRVAYRYFTDEILRGLRMQDAARKRQQQLRQVTPPAPRRFAREYFLRA